MKHIVFALMGAFLSGCASYVPQPLEISDAKQYAADVAACQAEAKAYKATLDVGSIASGVGTGAAQNAVGAAVNPLVPVIGAAGGGASALVSGLDVMGHASANVARHCLDEKVHRDRSAIVANPND